jgi:ADP-ribose pyrophosphatase YjhB (NUDIX family)
LPGGWVDVGDSPSGAIEREILEESGFQAKAIKLAMLIDKNKHPFAPAVYHVYKMYFLCELIGGTARTSSETDDVGFFPLSGLPELSPIRTLRSQVERLYEHQRNRALATDFD